MVKTCIGEILCDGILLRDGEGFWLNVVKTVILQKPLLVCLAEIICLDVVQDFSVFIGDGNDCPNQTLECLDCGLVILIVLGGTSFLSGCSDFLNSSIKILTGVIGNGLVIMIVQVGVNDVPNYAVILLLCGFRPSLCAIHGFAFALVFDKYTNEGVMCSNVQRWSLERYGLINHNSSCPGRVCPIHSMPYELLRLR